MSDFSVKGVQIDLSIVSDLLQKDPDFYHSFAMNSDRPNLLYAYFLHCQTYSWKENLLVMKLAVSSVKLFLQCKGL